MKELSQVDSNFKIETKIEKEDIRFWDIQQPPFVIYGVFHENGKFRRLPEAVANAVNEGVQVLHSHTAGGRVRFRTDSPYIAIHAIMEADGPYSHFAPTGYKGMDLYVEDEEGVEQYAGTFIPPADMTEGYEYAITLADSRMRDVTINLPLYSGVCRMYIGLSETAAVEAPEPYRFETPVVYYGSSITQGGCASRAGMSYQSIVARRLHADYVNLGFSGSARAEDTIIEYIKNLKMSVFVYDYDHNAPTVEHLEKTHEKMFRAIRAQQPELPIVMMSRPKFTLTSDEEQRLEIIRTTYRHAVEAGDKNVYLIEGKELMALAGNDGTVDNCHPNDLGFASMAKAVGDLLETLL